MKIKTSVAAVLAIVWATGSAWGQVPYAKPVQEFAGDREAEPAPAPTTSLTSRWLTPTPCLCDSPGEGPPIMSEAYFGTGVSLPFSAGGKHKDLLGRDMRTGFVVQGGVRTSFFNAPADKAWVVDISLSNANNGQDPTALYALRVLDFTGATDPATGQPVVKRIQFGTPTNPGLEIRSTNRTYVNLGFGRDWYLWTSVDDPGCHWRFGWEGGGRYGTLSQEYDRHRHRTDVIAGVFALVHTELEFPSRWGILQIGTRAEWGYTWSDILQRSSDIEEINLLFTVGLRF